MAYTTQDREEAKKQLGSKATGEKIQKRAQEIAAARTKKERSLPEGYLPGYRPEQVQPAIPDWLRGNIGTQETAFPTIYGGFITLEQAIEDVRQNPSMRPDEAAARISELQRQNVAFQQQNPSQGDSQSSASTGGSTQSYSSGNPEIDNFINNVYLPLFEAELSDDPTKLYNSDAFKQIAARVEAAYGPIFKTELDQIKTTFDRNSAELGSQRSEFEREFGTGADNQGTTLTRGLEDVTTTRNRLTEDVGVQKQRIARNYQEAMKDSEDALSNRNLLYGGTRIKEERRLNESKQDELNAVDSTSRRTLEDLQRQQDRMSSDVGFQRDTGLGRFGRQASELQSGYDLDTRKLEGEKTLQQAEERRRLLELGGTILSNPNFNPA